MSSDLGLYPTRRPERDGDGRFTIGLALDVAAVLADHGYPPITSPADLVRLQQALFTLIYRENTP